MKKNMLPGIFISFSLACVLFAAQPILAESADSPAQDAQLFEKAQRDAEIQEKLSRFSEIEVNSQFTPQSDWDAYPIHAGDKIKITVHGEKELSDIYVVDVAGDVYFPLVGKIHVDGINLNEFRENLRLMLARDYLANPQVEMTFEESIFNSVAILGQVNRPGNYILPPKMTFLRMISIAGGFSGGAAYATCKVMRTEPGGGKISLIADVEAMLDGKIEDMELKPGDVVYVPKIVSIFDEKDDYVNSVAVLGQVQKPGNYKLSAGMSVVRLLSQAGGMIRGADAGHVVLNRRPKDGRQNVSTVDVKKIISEGLEDVFLESGDVIYVPNLLINEGVLDLSRSVSILGQVQKPGNYDLVEGLGLIQLISQAGGFKPAANTARVRVTRPAEDGSKKVFEVNAAAVIGGKTDDFKMQARDIVYVPESIF